MPSSIPQVSLLLEGPRPGYGARRITWRNGDSIASYALAAGPASTPAERRGAATRRRASSSSARTVSRRPAIVSVAQSVDQLPLVHLRAPLDPDLLGPLLEILLAPVVVRPG